MRELGVPVKWVFVIVVMMWCASGCTGAKAPEKRANATQSNRVQQDRGRELDAKLRNAIAHRDRSEFERLLAQDANPNDCDNDGSSAMHLGAEQEDVYWLKRLKEHGGDPNQINLGNRFTPRRTPLFYAIEAEKIQCVRELITGGADVNHRDSEQTTPLIMAGQMFPAALLPLLEAGADPLAVDDEGAGLLNYWLTDDIAAIECPDKQHRAAARAFLTEKGLRLNARQDNSPSERRRKTTQEDFSK